VAAHGLGSRQVERTGEGAQPHLQRPFTGVEGIKAPAHGRSQRPVASHGAPPGVTQANVFAEPSFHLVEGKGVGEARRDFDRQGNAVDYPAHPGNGLHGSVVDRAVGPGGADDEKLDAVRVHQVLTSDRCAGLGGQGHWGHPPYRFARQSEGLPAGGEHPNVGTALQESPDQVGGRVEEVFAVVHDDENR